MALLKGAEVAKALDEKIKTELSMGSVTPQLDIIRVGAREDDLSYERGILKKMDKLGIGTLVHEFPEDIDNESFIEAFSAINKSPSVTGILCFMPLPKQLDARQIANIIDPQKDVDGISPINQARIYSGDKSGFGPCTAEAVIAILDHYGIKTEGKKVTVIGRSMVIGRPVAMMLMQKNTTVTICHTKTLDVEEECRCADIIIAAAGVPKMVTSDYVSEDAIVIDVGIHVDEQGHLCGDVDFEAVSGWCAAITPVPGGVGSVTTSVLASHLIR